jgi:GNAT superfamily N-acetyltransferase
MKSKIEIREINKGEYTISNDKSRLQLKTIHGYLSRSYWAENIDFTIVKNSVENSYCFGVYKEEEQIGFARLITDYATFAYLADVFILEEHRGKGLSKWLMEIIMSSPELNKLRGWMLKTKDAHGLYRKYGFEKSKFPERIMEYTTADKS